MNQTDSFTTRVENYTRRVLPQAHGHQQKAISDFLFALLLTQSCVQASLARCFDNFEAALRRLSRLLHNERIENEALSLAHAQALVAQLPLDGVLRLMLDWTREGSQHLLVAQLLVGRRALPLFWRAYADGQLKDRMKKYERELITTLLTEVLASVNPRRLLLLADRGFADVDFFALLDELGVAFLIRTKTSVKVLVQDRWQRLGALGWRKNLRRRALGRLWYNASDPRRYFVYQSRARNKEGRWETWHLIGNRPLSAQLAAAEYARRMCGEEGFRDAKRLFGFADAQIANLQAWAKMFALVALAMALLYGVAMQWLSQPKWRSWLRLITSRRRSRREVSLLFASLKLLFKDRHFAQWLDLPLKFNLEAHL